METLSTLQIKVLQILARRYGMSCTFNELINLLTPVISTSTTSKKDISTEIGRQALIVDALIDLNDGGHIFLNSITDNSCITIKGLLAVKNKDLYN